MRKRIGYISLCFFVVLAGDVMSQHDLVNALPEKLRNYYDAALPVKVHLFFNQPRYAPGDSVFYRAIFVTADQNKFVGGKQILHVYLLDQENKTVLSEKLRVSNGYGFSQFRLPIDIKSGLYRIVSFSSWMRNQDESFFFSQPFIISGEKEIKANAQKEVRFFPESGKLILGVTNRIGVLGWPGLSGKIVGPNDAVVAEVRCDRSGVGSFFLQPQHPSYRFISDEGIEQIIPLKATQGFNLLVSHANQGKDLKVVIQSNEEDKAESVILIAWHHGQVYYAATTPLTEGKNALVTFPLDRFPPGINGVSMFLPSGDLLAQRLFYVGTRNTDPVTIALDKNRYSPREDVFIKLKLNQAHARAKVALTMIVDDLFKIEPRHQSLSKYVNLTSDVADPATHLDFNDVESVDQWLITQSWKRFEWKDLFNEVNKNKYFFDTQIRFAGQAVLLENGKPVPDSTKLFFFLQNDISGYHTFTRADGTFDFGLPADVFGAEQVLYQGELKGLGRKNIQINTMDEITFSYPKTDHVVTDQLDPYYRFATERNQITEAFQTYKDPITSKKTESPNARFEEEVFGADITIRLKDYLLFPTMRETIHEIIPYLKVRKRGNRLVVRVFLDDIEMEGKDDPLYLIDGVLTDNTAYFLSLKPEDVVSIKLVNTYERLRILGDIAHSGIVMVETKILNNAQQVPRPHSVFKLQGITPPHKFHGMGIRNDARTPVIQSTLYWNPEIELTAEKEVIIKFKTPDNLGRLRIVVDGISSGGEAIYAEEFVDVVYP